MTETGFASLSSTLLARKGGARPAMRPQNGAPGVVDGKEAAASLEDLGWNDMGEEPAIRCNGPTGSPSGEVVSLPPTARHETLVRQARPEAILQNKPHSPVRDTIERIAQKLEAPLARSVAETQPRKFANVAAKRAAFTLRLDPDRHLKLRLACTVRGRSAQQLVTEALDALLSEMPDIDRLAAQVNRD